MTAIQSAYLANITLLLPIAVPTLLRLYRNDQAKFPESAGWRVLVGALWTAIMVLSALGLREPLRYSPVLLLQLIYKSLWLLVYALPLAVRGEWRLIPWGIAGSFLVIVMVWPWLYRGATCSVADFLRHNLAGSNEKVVHGFFAVGENLRELRLHEDGMQEVAKRTEG